MARGTLAAPKNHKGHSIDSKVAEPYLLVRSRKRGVQRQHQQVQVAVAFARAILVIPLLLLSQEAAGLFDLLLPREEQQDVSLAFGAVDLDRQVHGGLNIAGT